MTFKIKETSWHYKLNRFFDSTGDFFYNSSYLTKADYIVLTILKMILTVSITFALIALTAMIYSVLAPSTGSVAAIAVIGFLDCLVVLWCKNPGYFTKRFGLDDQIEIE